MTITVAIKVGDGVVLASDSATTQSIAGSNGQVMTSNIWNTANKIFNLHRDLPLASMTWGLASIDGLSIAEHMKDLRAELMRNPSDRGLDPGSYTVAEVANRVRDYFLARLNGTTPGYLGLLVTGYDATSRRPEVHVVNCGVDSGVGATEVAYDQAGTGLLQWGQPEAIARIVDGLSEAVPQALENLGVPAADAVLYADAIKAQVSRPIVWEGMPIGDVIELAEFLVEATIKFVRFSPGDPTVGGPIEVAVVTRHEGFKWVRRKHHFSQALNPS